MRIRKRKKRQSPLRLLPVLAAFLLIPMGINYLWHRGDGLGRAGERVAVLSAAINMPESGLDLLEERFRDAVYDPLREDGEHWTQPETEPGGGQPGAEESQVEVAGEVESAGESQAANSATGVQPKIPKSYQAALVSENFAAPAENSYIQFGAGYIKNDTGLTDEEVEEILETDMDLWFEDISEPQVLIVHTHATESFERYDSDIYDTRNTWRSRDNNSNMVAVGAAMAQVLEENGIGVIHDTSQHDYPSYNGSYDRSAETIKKHLEENPSIKIVLDLHRDAMERENQAIVKPVTTIDGRKAAQIMIIAACDDTETVGVPEYRKNLRFAASFQSYMEASFPELTRPVYFCYRKYNMDLTTGSLLLEFGSNANTLEEAIYSAQLAGQALSELILERSE